MDMYEYMNILLLEKVTLHNWLKNNKALSVFHKNTSRITKKN